MRCTDTWYDSNGNQIKYFNKCVRWKVGTDQPTNYAKKYGEVSGVSMFKGSDPGKKPMEWFFVPTWNGYSFKRNRIICVQQIVPLTTISSTTTINSRICNPVLLNGKESCFTYIGKRNRTEGEKACQAMNGTLPQPRSSSDVFNLLAVLLKSASNSGFVPFYIDMFRIASKGKS